jgi:hypothetical protein
MRHASFAAFAGFILQAISSSLALAQTTAPGTGPGGAAASGGGIADWWWVILLVIVVAVAIWYFTRGRRQV